MAPPKDQVILNLGCGYKTTPYTVDIDFSIQQRIRASRFAPLIAKVALNDTRREMFDTMAADDVLVHDLRKGIPYPDGSVDAVYHSHVLEHIDRDHAPGFFAEILRVLRPGGIHRLALPDLREVVQRYLDSYERQDPNHAETGVRPLYGQSVQREAHGTSLQKPLRRKIENLLLGDARKRGETHQWMYDEVSLTQALIAAGFVDPVRLDAYTSDVPGWNEIGLDLNADRSAPHKPGSLWMEARKPG
ncbi:MAG: class I SAM-dependent methyltransferase [Solirubrobacteraceae bacterium]|nr:class I SAM-dependent methyltransferase [Solirubrobacteraceae bacterium]